MAAALSRALKLPGKKGSDLGEYDPLTQADSEDESEEDDLVLNYPPNGLGRGTCMAAGTSELRAGRTGRLVEDHDEVDDEDEEDWRVGKVKQDRDKVKARQCWSHRESGREGRTDGRGGSGSLGNNGLTLDSPSDPEGKRVRMREALRTTLFLVPLCCATLLVLLCAFLLPCPEGELSHRPHWDAELGELGHVNTPPLALWDVDNDTVEDVLVGVTQPSNDSVAGFSHNSSKEYSVLALSALSGTVLWRRMLKEPVQYIQCGVQPQPRMSAVRVPTRRSPRSVCLLATSARLTAVDSGTGKVLWKTSPGKIVSQVVSIPDLNGDAVPDLLTATFPADQVSDLSLLLLSGLSGTLIGHPVTFNVTAQGKLIGPELHVTRTGAYYILFGLGTVEAAWLMDIYIKAMVRVNTRVKVSPVLKVKDPMWEKMRKTNSSLIHIRTEQVSFFLPLAAGLCGSHNGLDFTSSVNSSSSSDWVLVCGANRLSVVRERDAHTAWSVTSLPIHSRPASGYFNQDRIPDLLIQQSVAPGLRKVQIVDGASGRGLWEAQFVCPGQLLEGSSVMTSSGQSVFLFWAGELLPRNHSSTTVSPAETPVLRRLYLLHPAYPTILLELTTTTDTVLTSAVSYQEQQKDASYITVSSRPALSLRSASQLVRTISLRASIPPGHIIRLDEPGSALTPEDAHIHKFFSQVAFWHRQ